MRAHHVLGVDHCTIEDFDGLGAAISVVGVAAEEVHTDAVALLHHRLPLLARRHDIAARFAVAADGHDAAIGTGSPARRGEYPREDPREA